MENWSIDKVPRERNAEPRLETVLLFDHDVVLYHKHPHIAMILSL